MIEQPYSSLMKESCKFLSVPPAKTFLMVLFLPILQDLSNETIARLDAENKYQTLLEEMEFLKSVHEQVSTVNYWV